MRVWVVVAFHGLSCGSFSLVGLLLGKEKIFLLGKLLLTGVCKISCNKWHLSENPSLIASQLH